MWYRIILCTKHGRSGYESRYFIDVEAGNLKEAKNKAEELWYRDNVRHAFHVKASRLHGSVIAEYFARSQDYPEVKACLDHYGYQCKPW